MIGDLTHPESPKMMTFKSTFFLEVILQQLEGDKEQLFRQGCVSLYHCTIQIHKRLHQTLRHVCAGDWTNQLRGPHGRHVTPELLTESRGTHRAFFCAHRKSRPGGLTPLLLILKNHTFYFWQCCWAPREQKSVHVNTARAYNSTRNIRLKGFLYAGEQWPRLDWSPLDNKDQKTIPKSWGRKHASFKPMWFRNLQLQRSFLNHINQTEEGWTVDRMRRGATPLKSDAYTRAFISHEF